MAYNIHWKIKFKSLRAGTDYTVNIYKDGTLPSGYPLTLKPGGQPFTTQEAEDEDIFMPIRTQTGYMRIVDDGRATTANNQTINNWNWKELLPNTDTDRPVTLTDGSGNIVWQGYMQAQNFSGTLYGNPQERTLPLLCPLSALTASDVDADVRDIKNFAYIIWHALSSLPGITINKIYFAGNTEALLWLQKMVDWQNMVEEDSEGNIVALYNHQTAIEDVCRFWGWSVRFCEKYVIFSKPSQNVSYRELTMAELGGIADGTLTGTNIGSERSFSSVTLSGDIFASTENDDYMVRGNSKATINANCNEADSELFEAFPEKVIEEMEYEGNSYTEHEMSYSGDITTIQTPYIEATANGASFNLAENIFSDISYKAIRIRSTYTGTPLVRIQTRFAHGYYMPSEGLSNIFVQYRGIKMQIGGLYSKGVKYEEFNESGANIGLSKGSFKVRIGIGKTYETALWYGSGTGSSLWGETPVSITVRMKENGSLQPSVIPTNQANLYGYLFFEIMGSEDMPLVDNVRKFDIADFVLSVKQTALDFTSFTNQEKKLSTKGVYVKKNTNKVRDEWTDDLIWASDNNLSRGYGIVLNTDGSRMEKAQMGGTDIHPEQDRVNRIANYWSTSKRSLRLELRSDAIGNILPYNGVSLESQNFTPISISHEWRDDVTILTILES